MQWHVSNQRPPPADWSLLPASLWGSPLAPSRSLPRPACCSGWYQPGSLQLERKSIENFARLKGALCCSASVLLYCTSWKIFRESFGIIHSLLSRSVGVQVSPHVLDLQLQIQLRALPGPLFHMYMQTLVNKPQDIFCIIESSSHLKRHMFQEVCCAIISLILIATASIYPEAHLQNNGCEYPHIDTNLTSQRRGTKYWVYVDGMLILLCRCWGPSPQKQPGVRFPKWSVWFQGHLEPPAEPEWPKVCVAELWAADGKQPVMMMSPGKQLRFFQRRRIYEAYFVTCLIILHSKF